MKIWESTWNWIGSPYMWLRAWIQWHAALRAGKRVLRLYAGQIRTLTQNEEYDFVWLHNATLEISGWQFIWHDVLFITGMACIRSDAGIPRISQEPEVHSGSGDPPNQGQAGDVEASGGPGCARPPEPITRIDIYPSSFVSRGEANGGAGGSGGIVRLETGHSEMILYDSACKAAYLAALSQWLDCPIRRPPGQSMSGSAVHMWRRRKPMKRSMHKAADRLADDTAGVINDGGQALVWFWKAGWSLAALLLTAATAAAWWIRRQPDALRARQRLERTRLRDRDRRAAQSPAEFH